MSAVEKPGHQRPLTVEANLGLVHAIVKKFRWAIGTALDEDDLAQAGALGLMRALETYQPELGFAFSTYAQWWIRHHVRRCIENQQRLVRVPVHRQSTAWRNGEPIPVNAHSLNAPVNQNDPGSDTWLDMLPADRESSEPEEQMAIAQRNAAVHAALAQLPERTRQILMARFGDDERTLQEIAEPLGLSRERVRQIAEAALVELRCAFAGRGVRSLRQL